MINRLRAGSFPSMDPELRPFRARIGQLAIFATFTALCVWLIVDLMQLWRSELVRFEDLWFEFLSILFLAFSSALALRMIKRGNIGAAGYTLAFALFLFSFFRIMLFPADLYLLSGILLAPILVVGAITGGYSPIVFSLLASLTVVFAWLRLRGLEMEPAYLYTSSAGLTFLSIQIVIQQALAVLLVSLSRHIERTIQRLRSHTEQLTLLAHTDPLTALANRRYLIEQLEREFARAKRYRRPLALLYIDLDGFKAINDRFGHLFGDEILRSLSMAIRAVLRSTDLLARIGGDEFAVLLPETTIKDAVGVANKLRKALGAYGASLGTSVPPLTFCAGVAQMREEDETIDDLLARADQAQYSAKTSGKAQIRSQLDINQLPLFEEEASSSDQQD